MRRFFILLALIPLVELALLIEFGRWAGTGFTVMLVVVTALLGSFLARSQGLAVFKRTQTQLARGQTPEEGLVDALLILISGFLLILPGLVTDTIGLILAIPMTRRIIKLWLRTRLERWIETGVVRIRLR